MRNTILTILLLLFTHSAVAATVTVYASATILEPVKISYHNRDHSYAAIDSGKALSVQSTRKLHYDLSRNRRDVCMFKETKGGTQTMALAQADCRTVTINFN